MFLIYWITSNIIEKNIDILSRDVHSIYVRKNVFLMCNLLIQIYFITTERLFFSYVTNYERSYIS